MAKEETSDSEFAIKVNNFYSLQFRWKRKQWYLIILFNFSMAILLTIERILSSKLSNPDTTKIVLASLVLPLLGLLLAFYLKIATSEYKDCSSIIKKDRLKYFYRGVFSSFMSFNVTLVSLVASYCLIEPRTAKITVFSAIGVCIILGIISSVFISMYEFCVCFDLFYHKNKETIIQEYLTRNNNLKILEEKRENAD